MFMQVEYHGKMPVAWLTGEELRPTNMEPRLHAVYIATKLSKLFASEVDAFEILTADNGHDLIIRIYTIVFDVFGDDVRTFLTCLSNADHFAVTSKDEDSVTADFTVKDFWA